MNIIGICAILCSRIKIYTFALMSNHIHVTAAGNKEDVEDFCRRLKKYLGKWLASSEKTIDLKGWSLSIRQITTLKDLRNVIAYNNRNGFLVAPEETPFSYLWGANRYFFNREAQLRYAESGGKRNMTKQEKRDLIRSHDADQTTGPIMLDGYACPLSFCSVRGAESIFRNASSYLAAITRNIESQKEIAAEIGERIFYNDNELYSLCARMAKEQFSIPNPSLIPKDGKISIAKTLHYDYNAGNKQIIRLLSLDPGTVNSLFPESR